VIKNERQYRITRTQAERFAQALRQFEAGESTSEGLHPLLLKAREDALRSQLTDLEEDLREYEALKAGTFKFEQLRTITELPNQLIRARIAGGLSQRDLAERLGLKEQQIQRYEASDYSSASFARIKNVVVALGVDVGDSMVLDEDGVSLRTLLNRVAETGLPAEFVHKRLVPRRWSPLNLEDEGQKEATLTHPAVETIAKIFQWSSRQLLRGDTLDMQPAISGVRFKVSASANPERVNAYTVYAHYLALLVAQACSHGQIRPIPTDPQEFRTAVESTYGSMHLGSVVNYIWDCGVPVLPLDDPGAFHGACFREDGRNVIVLKQKTSSESRWAFDLLHESWHAGQEPELPERTVLESDEIAAHEELSEEEKTASRFAAAILLNGRGQELAERCLAEAGNNVRRLKSAVQRVASQEGAPVDSLANYMAFRLGAEQHQNWWGTANSLQSVGNPWAVVRNVFFERADFTKLAEPDRELLAQALAPWEEITYG
jgi:transcriptional regulator with XRE-family HTH domain